VEWSGSGGGGEIARVLTHVGTVSSFVVRRHLCLVGLKAVYGIIDTDDEPDY
jgi:hypothetical protein